VDLEKAVTEALQSDETKRNFRFFVSLKENDVLSLTRALEEKEEALAKERKEKEEALAKERKEKEEALAKEKQVTEILLKGKEDLLKEKEEALARERKALQKEEVHVKEKDDVIRDLRKSLLREEIRNDYLDGILNARSLFEKFERELEPLLTEAIRDQYKFPKEVKSARQKLWYISFTRRNQLDPDMCNALVEIASTLHRRRLPGNVWEVDHVILYVSAAVELYGKLSSRIHDFKSEMAGTLKLYTHLLHDEGVAYMVGIARAWRLEPLIASKPPVTDTQDTQ
jgi:hypothetical protein